MLSSRHEIAHDVNGGHDRYAKGLKTARARLETVSGNAAAAHTGCEEQHHQPMYQPAEEMPTAHHAPVPTGMVQPVAYETTHGPGYTVAGTAQAYPQLHTRPGTAPMLPTCGPSCGPSPYPGGPPQPPATRMPYHGGAPVGTRPSTAARQVRPTTQRVRPKTAGSHGYRYEAHTKTYKPFDGMGTQLSQAHGMHCFGTDYALMDVADPVYTRYVHRAHHETPSLNPTLRNKPELSGYRFFDNTRVRTSIGKINIGGTMYAVPFITSRTKTPEKLGHHNRMSSASEYQKQFDRKPYCFSSMNRKPLTPYRQHAFRSRLAVADPLTPAWNESRIKIQHRFGTCEKRRFVSNHRNEYRGEGGDPRTNTGIVSYTTKWRHHLAAK
uniref:Uncharacterized protein n=1 Tax=Chromera velia CCMP2878 TaxID=1169474 RepID=A0A0G4I0G3_9ALVE|eukprot:Cvel_9954.t1-p1 / transcript=Cvel_9954.t1 / gene=Cvel_9954 / organism=Chromera_velia_CCMP2878 / gene_product=hypothetical protein / transcript_product=hypothetical protein / location=Cvel_scaffold589:45645-46784(+) / protein_length=380 / sequence_SO=supercontig / SO=protein_coding / is_pseudo=false